MVKTDYILRMIEQASAFLAAIVFNKKVQNYDFALERITEAYNGLLYLGAGELKNFSVADIVKSNTQRGELDRTSVEVIACLMFEEADINERINGANAASLALYEKSLALFLLLCESADARKFHNNADEIAEKLESYETDGDLARKMCAHYENRGLYGKAEDMMYELMSSGLPGAKDETAAFYRRLLALSDEALENGNLPRAEVANGLAELDARG